MPTPWEIPKNKSVFEYFSQNGHDRGEASLVKTVSDLYLLSV